MFDTAVNHPYTGEPRFQREDILVRLLGISQLEYEDDLYTHHEGGVWDYFGEIDLKQSTDESAKFWVWVQSGAGLQGEIEEDGLVFEHSLNVTYGIPIVMGDEIGAPDDKCPRYDRAYTELPDYVWVVAARRGWRDQSINAANDVGMGYDSALPRFQAAQRNLPGKRPKPLPPPKYDENGELLF
jgi:hypothetical protein